MLSSKLCFRGFIFSICFWFFLNGATNTQAQTRAYVANPIPSRSVTVIDADTNTLVTKIPVCSDLSCSPTIPAVTPNGARVYVTNNLQDTVTVIDTLTNTVIDTITVGPSPWGIAITPDGRRAYVASRTAGIVVIDTSTNTVITTIPDSAMPLGVAIPPDGSRAYVSNALASVSVVDISTNTIVTNIPLIDFVGPFPFPPDNQFAIALIPDGTRAYVVSQDNGDTFVIDTISNTQIATVRTDEVTSGTAVSIAMSPNGRRAYVAAVGFSALVLIIDTGSNTIIGTINTSGPQPFVGITPDGTRLYINALEAAGDERSVTIIDTATNAIITKILTHDPEWGIAFGTLPPVPKTKDDCKSSGYQRFTVLDFPNQGQCLKYVKEHGN